jgi:hypothetical protein
VLQKIISAGQSGADQAAWRAAKAFGIPTGGWMPLGFKTEDGPRPEFTELYGAHEMPTTEYPPRTVQNVIDSDATLWFGSTDTPGAKTTMKACLKHGREILCIYPGADIKPSQVVQGLQSKPGIRVLNVAGNRASKARDIGYDVERFMRTVLRRLGYQEVRESP